ncbi:MAG: hypothetical protein QF410_07250, partial [Planctomycetota bacterium]|nr:hypothetical protein [Planctomycetota bacterium]
TACHTRSLYFCLPISSISSICSTAPRSPRPPLPPRSPRPPRRRLDRGVEGVESPYSLLAASDARYGERPSVHSNPAGAAYLGRILAEPARLARRAAGSRGAGGGRSPKADSVGAATP